MRNRTKFQIFIGGISISVALLSSLLLIGDATTFDLQGADGQTGRIKGCYTMIDDLLQTVTPLAWARPAELTLVLLLVAGAVWTVRRLMRAPAHAATLVEHQAEQA